MRASTMTIRPGEFWLASVPFTDGSGAKIRPVLVLWLDGQDAVIAAVTSTPRTSTDVLLNDWQASGLKRPSTVRLSRLACLHQALLHTQRGHVSQTDGRRLKEIWTKHVKLRF